MAAADHLPLTEVKNRLSEVVERLDREHGRVVITKHGRPAAVMLIAAGRAVPLTRVEALGRIKRS